MKFIEINFYLDQFASFRILLRFGYLHIINSVQFKNRFPHSSKLRQTVVVISEVPSASGTRTDEAIILPSHKDFVDDDKRRTSNGTFSPPTYFATYSLETKPRRLMNRVELRELPSATVISSCLLSFACPTLLLPSEASHHVNGIRLQQKHNLPFLAIEHKTHQNEIIIIATNPSFICAGFSRWCVLIMTLIVSICSFGW